MMLPGTKKEWRMAGVVDSTQQRGQFAETLVLQLRSQFAAASAASSHSEQRQQQQAASAEPSVAPVPPQHGAAGAAAAAQALPAAAAGLGAPAAPPPLQHGAAGAAAAAQAAAQAMEAIEAFVASVRGSPNPFQQVTQRPPALPLAQPAAPNYQPRGLFQQQQHPHGTAQPPAPAPAAHFPWVQPAGGSVPTAAGGPAAAARGYQPRRLFRRQQQQQPGGPLLHLGVPGGQQTGVLPPSGSGAALAPVVAGPRAHGTPPQVAQQPTLHASPPPAHPEAAGASTSQSFASLAEAYHTAGACTPPLAVFMVQREHDGSYYFMVRCRLSLAAPGV